MNFNHKALLLLASDGGFPSYAIYDDGCHLVQFIKNHLGHDFRKMRATQCLDQIKCSVDRVHFKNQVGTWCRCNMNSDKNLRKLCLLDESKIHTHI